MSETHNAILSYQSPTNSGEPGTLVGPLDDEFGIVSVQNASSVATYSLSDATRIQTSSGTIEFAIPVRVSNVGTLDSAQLPNTIALIGVKTLVTEAAIRAQTVSFLFELTVGGNTYNSFAEIYPSRLTRETFSGDVVGDTELLGEGLANVVFHGVELPTDAQDVTFTLNFNVRGNASFFTSGFTMLIGSVFIGSELPIALVPDSFSWGTEIIQESHLSRSLGLFAGDGVLRRSINFELFDISIDEITGATGNYMGGGNRNELPPMLYQAMINNVGQPMLMSPYPYPVENTVWDLTTPDATELEQRKFSARQNFFSVYGLFDRQSQVDVGEFNAGLDTRYRTRMRFGEVR